MAPKLPPLSYELSPSLLKKLSTFPSKCKGEPQKDGPNIGTCLVKLWTAATPEDKIELNNLVKQELNGDLVLTATTLLNEYPRFRVYEKSCLQTALGNARKTEKRVAKSMYCSSRHLCLRQKSRHSHRSSCS